MIFFAVSVLMVINLAVSYYPTIFFSRQAGKLGANLFIIPALVGLPVFFAQICAPFYLDLPTDGMDYFAICLVSDNIYGLARIVVMLGIWKLFGTRKRISNFVILMFSVDLTKTRNISTMKIIATGFLLCGVVCLLVLAEVSGFGIWNWIMEPRVGYQSYRRGNGHYWVLSQVFLSFSTYISLFLSQKRLEFVLHTLLNGIVWWFLGSKGYLIGFGGFTIGMWFYKFGRSYLVFGTFSFLVFLFMIANWFLSSRLPFEVDSLKGIFTYFDMYPVGIMYYKEYFSGGIGLYNGFIFLTNFWLYVPRALYQDKPYEHGISVIVEAFFPGGAESGNTPGFAGAVEQFADFGYIGLIISPLLDLTFLMRTIATITVCRALSDGSWKSGRVFLLSLFFLSPNWTPLTAGGYILLLLVFSTLGFFILGLPMIRHGGKALFNSRGMPNMAGKQSNITS